MVKNIVLCFDGTWNVPDLDHSDGDESTNVWRFHQQLATTKNQVKWYDQGVGTKWFNRLRGGIFGRGLCNNICEGYEYLARNYNEGDKVFLIGFSRGAYTARSLAGMLNRVGLVKDLDKNLHNTVNEFFSVYESKDESAQRKIKNAYYSRSCSIHMIGVFDTVGALGVPLSFLNNSNQQEISFHDCSVSEEVSHAYHLIALDEERKKFSPTLWDEQKSSCRHIEQVWFSGAHADIGGGYIEKGLSNITLNWLKQKSKVHGLIFNSTQMQAENNMQRVHDSYSWWYGARGQRIFPENSIIHDTAVDKIMRDPQYNSSMAHNLRASLVTQIDQFEQLAL